jgi:hypothetical protein
MKLIMRTIIAPVDTRKIKMPENEIRHLFGMEVPTHIHIVFTDELLAKMKHIQHLIKENNLTSIETLSSYRKAPDSSYALFYKDGELMKITKYMDGYVKYDTVELNNFTLTCQSVHTRNFSASFLYNNETCHALEVQTKYFDID